MQCDICERESLRMCCSPCARHTLWPLRYDTILRTSEKVAAEEKINAYLTAKPPEAARPGVKDLSALDGKEVKSLRVQTEESKLIISKIMEENDKVRTEIDEAKERIAALKELNKSRKLTFHEYNKGLRDRRVVALENIQKETKRTRQRWNIVQTKIADARSYLCYEAASLYGLKQRRRRGGIIEYFIGGNSIPSFQDLAVHPPILTTTTFGHLCNLLMLISDYCGIKLPYEIVLPGKHSQYPSIKTPNNPLSRLVHLDSPLTDLFRENSNDYTLFLEGASMLAYNIAWLCLTQGMEIANVEEAMHPGKNLYTLLIGGGHGPSSNFGRWSHATTGGGFLGGKEGYLLTREWNIDLREIVKKLEMIVHGQNMKLEWDLVEEVVGEDEEETFSGLEKVSTKRGTQGYRNVSEPTGWTKVRAKAGS
ncbi:UV radiation resistance protein and autophagy-related subunit 14-domain-containing protein [Kalaharituber pfeilii]|nr:UV radiation resistance protein and autophagy-related subunit 14-domain-containing protein [Kalaharituber pfeilii]